MYSTDFLPKKNRQCQRPSVRGCLCHCLIDGMYRSHGYRRLHPGRNAGRLLHPRGKIRSRLYHCSHYDLLHGKRMCFLLHCRSLPHRIYPNLLRGREPRLGQEIPRGKYASGGDSGNYYGISALGAIGSCNVFRYAPIWVMLKVHFSIMLQQQSCIWLFRNPQRYLLFLLRHPWKTHHTEKLSHQLSHSPTL